MTENYTKKAKKLVDDNTFHVSRQIEDAGGEEAFYKDAKRFLLLEANDDEMWITFYDNIEDSLSHVESLVDSIYWGLFGVFDLKKDIDLPIKVTATLSKI